MASTITPPLSCFNSRAHGARDEGCCDFAQSGLGFNSRAHGARDASAANTRRNAAVSIHARTGRATLGKVQLQKTKGFNSRAHGARDIHVVFVLGGEGFQFTRARGARQYKAAIPTNISSFNSRAHGARDTLTSSPAQLRGVSIHARTGRATGGP